MMLMSTGYAIRDDLINSLIEARLEQTGYATAGRTVTTVHAVIPCAIKWTVLVAWRPDDCTFLYHFPALPIAFPSPIQDWFVKQFLPPAGMLCVFCCHSITI